MILLDKKFRYFIHSVVVLLSIYLFSKDYDFKYAILAMVIAVMGTVFVHYPNVNWKNFFLSNILPAHLVSGTLLSLYYFPNLALPVEILFMLCAGAGFYLVSLVNNVFLVVEDKKEIIPLYRVAVTWSQIIFVTVSIPFFAGVFKLPTNSIFQNLISTFSAISFSTYLIWILHFDPDVKKARGLEIVILNLLNGFFVFTSGISSSFIPVESFLRALFVSSVLMFGISYISSHLKNSVTKRSLTESIIITFVFFALLLIFQV